MHNYRCDQSVRFIRTFYANECSRWFPDKLSDFLSVELDVTVFVCWSSILFYLSVCLFFNILFSILFPLELYYWLIIRQPVYPSLFYQISCPNFLQSAFVSLGLIFCAAVHVLSVSISFCLSVKVCFIFSKSRPDVYTWLFHRPCFVCLNLRLSAKVCFIFSKSRPAVRPTQA